MSYCRFENTSRDLKDCMDNMNEAVSEREHKAKLELIYTCYSILENLGVVIETEVEEVIDLEIHNEIVRKGRVEESERMEQSNQ